MAFRTKFKFQPIPICSLYISAFINVYFQCSYIADRCSDGNEYLFTDTNKTGLMLPCYHSPSNQEKIILKKTYFEKEWGGLGFMFCLLVSGVVLIISIKFMGHKMGCPPDNAVPPQQGHVPMQPVAT